MFSFVYHETGSRPQLRSMPSLSFLIAYHPGGAGYINQALPGVQLVPRFINLIKLTDLRLCQEGKTLS